jgi:formiminotetrahydrofolate cyclodeaminase
MSMNTSDILSMPIRSFVSATAAKTPTPGGGSVAALAGALGAALAEMSVNYSLGKKSLAGHQAALADAKERLQRAAVMMLELVEEDIAAYEALSGQLKLPAEERGKSAEFLPALSAAIAVPESIGALALNIVAMCDELYDKSNPFLHSDLVLAGAMANAAVRGAELNILANVSLVPAKDEAEAIKKRAAEMVAKADAGYLELRKKF